VRATLLLCDAVQFIDGKLYVLGWGWSYTPPGRPHGLGVKIDIGWTELDVAHHVELHLEDEDGQPVFVDGPDGGRQAIQIQADITVPRLPEIAEGTSVSVPMGHSIGPLPLEPGRRYSWRLTIDGESDEDWRATFTVVQPPAEAAAGGPLDPPATAE
jgi:hypothetical protein